MNLNELLEKIPEDNATFGIYVEKLKRKAEKGLLEGITVDDIDTALKNFRNDITDNPVVRYTDFEYTTLIKESQDAINYYYKYISNISEAIQNIDNIHSVSFITESVEQNFDSDSLEKVKSILENLKIEDISELLEYYSYINSDRKALIESCIENEIVNFLNESEMSNDIDIDIDELLQEGVVKDAAMGVANTVKSAGKNFIANVKTPKEALVGMSGAVSKAMGNVGSAAIAYPLGALALGGIYVLGAAGRRLISKALAKRREKKLAKQQMYESFVDLNEKKTIEDFLA